MSPEPLDSLLWKSTSAFSGSAAELVPVIRRIQKSNDWAKADAVADDWAVLSREIVDGSDLSPAVRLVLPWVVELSRGRRPDELMQAWALIGEVEIGRLLGKHEPSANPVLNDAAEVAGLAPGTGLTSMQNELAAAICLLPILPDWGRLVILRMVVLGQRYTSCPACGELLDVERKGTWRIGNEGVEPARASDERQRFLGIIREVAITHEAPALQAIDEVVGVVRCPRCNARNDALAILAHPLQVPA